MIGPVFKKKSKKKKDPPPQAKNKKRDKSKFSWLAQLFKHSFKIKIQPYVSEQEKKRQRIYDLLNAETQPKFLCQPYTKQKNKTKKKNK